MVSTAPKVRQKRVYTKEQEQQMLTDCLTASGFTIYPEELRRAEGESVVFLNGTVQHYKDYSSWAECSREMPYYSQALILVASGAIHQDLCSSFNL